MSCSRWTFSRWYTYDDGHAFVVCGEDHEFTVDQLRADILGCADQVMARAREHHSTQPTEAEKWELVGYMAEYLEDRLTEEERRQGLDRAGQREARHAAFRQILDEAVRKDMAGKEG